MDVPAKLSALLLIMSVLLLVLLLKQMRVFYRTNKKLTMADYGIIGSCCFFILGSIVGSLGHIGWMIISVLTGFICLAVIASLSRDGRARAEATQVEAIKKVNISEPIRFKDFFSGYGLILKLNRKYGTQKAIVIQSSISACIMAIGMVLISFLIHELIFVNDLWHEYGWLTFSVMFVTVFIVSFCMNYDPQKRVLKKFEALSSSQQLHSYTPPPNTQSPQSSDDVIVNFCTNCGASVVPGAVFCINCGKQIH
jgi:divalent metal cation (Fe/Co/Zn/Cd) transporter